MVQISNLRLAAAYHEAGHALLVALGGGEIDEVTANSDGSGKTIHYALDNPDQEALTVVAGPMGEFYFLTRILGEKIDKQEFIYSAYLDKNSNDRVHFLETRGSLLWEEAAGQAWLAIAFNHTPAFKAITDGLVKTGHLWGDEVLKIVEAKSPGWKKPAAAPLIQKAPENTPPPGAKKYYLPGGQVCWISPRDEPATLSTTTPRAQDGGEGRRYYLPDGSYGLIYSKKL